MTLILHAGANPVTYDELRAISTPEPTASHVPIPHHEIVELMRYTLGFYGHEVIEEHHGITPDGNRYFGVLEVPPLSWTPKHLCFRSPRCRRNAPHTRLSSGGR